MSPGLWHIGGTLAGTTFCECMERNRSENSQVASWWHIEQATNNSKSRQQTIQSEKSENSDRQQIIQFICCLIFLPNFRLSIYLFSLFSRFLLVCCQEVCDIAGLPIHFRRRAPSESFVGLKPQSANVRPIRQRPRASG